MKRIVIFLTLFAFCKLSSGQKLNVPPADNSTYSGKAMFGYQGWYGHPDDNSSLHDFFHWGNMEIIGIEDLSVDMYPDLREYCSSERYPTAYTMTDGKVAEVYSAGNRQTVLRHIKWVRDYNTDGVWVQRFISECVDSDYRSFRDSTTIFVKEGCEKYGRIFAIMYDGIANMVDEIKNDWKHLIDDLKLTESDRYLQHNDLPIIALWGYTVDNDAKVEELEELIEFFHNNPEPRYRASVKLGVNDNWFTREQRWLNAFAQVEVISPWSVGRYKYSIEYENYIINQIIPGMNWCAAHEILFVPVLFPGFSWHNLTNGGPENDFPRNGGDFFWMQVYGAINNNVKSFYFAMLDELDEGTAFFKTAENASMSPAQEYWLNLDADGYELPSDWYLRCAGKAAEALRGNIPNSPILGLPEEGIMTIRSDIDSCKMTFIFPDFEDVTSLEMSIDGGNSFPYTVSDEAGTYEIINLEKGTYEVMVRNADSIQKVVPMGKVCVEKDCFATSSQILPGNTGMKGVKIYPNPVKDYLNIVIPENSSAQGQISTLAGSVISEFKLQKRINRIDLKRFVSGTYMLFIKSETSACTVKLVIIDN